MVPKLVADALITGRRVAPSLRGPEKRDYALDRHSPYAVSVAQPRGRQLPTPTHHRHQQHQCYMPPVAPPQQHGHQDDWRLPRERPPPAPQHPLSPPPQPAASKCGCDLPPPCPSLKDSAERKIYLAPPARRKFLMFPFRFRSWRLCRRLAGKKGALVGVAART